MKDEIKEILDKLSNRKQETLIQGLRECQLKDIEHPFITREEYIDKILDYITNLQEENEKVHKELDYADNYNIYLISKIDKAIEYIEKYSSISGYYFNSKYNRENDCLDVKERLLNILQGKSDE